MRLPSLALVHRPRAFERISLARQFLLASAVVLLIGVAALGNWVGARIEATEVHREARIAAVYVESILAARLNEVVQAGRVSADTRDLLDGIFVAGPLARKVVRFKLWTADGHVHYSSDPSQELRTWPLHEHQAWAFGGTLQANISSLDGPDNAAERAQWQRLIEVYVPLHAAGSSGVAAVAEFYMSMADLEEDIRADQRQSWVAITLGALLLFSSLYTLVHRASLTISGQRFDLEAQLADLRRLLGENSAMHQRVQQAGARTTAMSELALRRIAADLHDGPAQDLAFSLLTLDDRWQAATPADLARLRSSLERSMAMLRDIAGGLVVPGMAQMTLAEVVQRAARDATQKSGAAVSAQVDESLLEAPEAVMITAYRVVQEAVSNSLRHAAGHTPHVVARREDDALVLEISDDGPGFDADGPVTAGHLGLAFLRERVQLLGGSIVIRSAPGQGTLVTTRIPLSVPEGGHA
jgi:signal transduction histidine kinase